MSRSDISLPLANEIPGVVVACAASISDALAEFAAASVPADPDLDVHATRILADAASDTGDDACLLAARIG
jgi:hypothetical protein